MIRKGQECIEDIETWRRLASPKHNVHWQDGRSAKEAARAWTQLEPGTFPPEVLHTLLSHTDFAPIVNWYAEPEARVTFDCYGGEPANLDLIVHARDRIGSLLIAVEAKADESFGRTLAGTYSAAAKRKAKNPRSKGLDRIEHLAKVILGVPREELTRVDMLRYQLLTATAAGVAKAQHRSICRVVLLVHEFVTKRTSDRKHARNAEDLDAFIRHISGRSVAKVRADSLCGPLELPIGGGIQFYVGKAVRDLRD